MNTIEERADAYVGHPREIGEDISFAMSRKAYIQGAEEQRKIDIEKACEWLKKNYQNLDYINYEGDLFDISLVEDFRKAMEEDL